VFQAQLEDRPDAGSAMNVGIRSAWSRGMCGDQLAFVSGHRTDAIVAR
jgi:hypothetical protein